MMTSFHNSRIFIVFSLLVSVKFSLQAFSSNGIVLSSTKSYTFSTNRTIASYDEVFELGIFKLDSTSPDEDRWYLGIWFKKISTKPYVWVANRESPLSHPMGTLRVSRSNLVLVDDHSNSIVWSEKITKESELSPSVVAELLPDGNFVLRHSNSSVRGEFLWQRFDSSTNTLLPGMKLSWELETGRSRFLQSWNDITDPSSANYSYGIESVGENPNFPSTYIWLDKKYRVSRMSLWNGHLSGGVSGDVPRTQIMSVTFAFISNDKEVSLSFQTSDTKSTYVLRLSSKGVLQQLIWNVTSTDWDILWGFPGDRCDIYETCGPNSYCEIPAAPRLACKCITGFKPKDPQAWELENWTNGCVRHTPLSCGASKVGFFRLVNVRLPDSTNSTVTWDIGSEECEQRCVKDCSCTAFTTARLTGRTGCVTLTRELLDVRKYVADGHDLHVKEGFAEKKDKKTHTKLIIILSLALLVIIISLCLIYFYWKRMKKRARARADLALATSFGNLPGENIIDNLDLPVITFDTISLATDNFFVSNKLGNGGFGTVYKGRLSDGQEIAVKRLSKISGQGMVEFKNELILITKIQHINLVRLIAYCLNGDEKLLIYEYLENRSLDMHLFDETQSCKLNWAQRFEITKGIARGLLYLHQDSAVLIVHRDLKPSNVLLDKNMNRRSRTLGMARIFERGIGSVNTTRVVGTHGYMSPEYSQEGVYSVKSDVFSFGVMILEILSGKRNKGFAESNNGVSLVSYAWKKWQQGRWACVIDPIIDPSSEEVERCFKVGLLCVQDRPEDRPLMSCVFVMLESNRETIPQPHPPGYYVDVSAYASTSAESVNCASTVVVDPR